MISLTRSHHTDTAPGSVALPDGDRPPLMISCGVGVDSVAMLVGLAARGIRPDLIQFADTGSEKAQTYLYVPLLRQWLRDQGFPDLVTVWYRGPIAQDESLHAACQRKQMLPDIAYAFQRRGCSVKWKHDPLESWRKRWLPADRAGRLMIGFDATETARTFRAESHGQRWQTSYPLQEWGWDRAECERQIAAAGLPVPVKSACFMCPASKAGEIRDLARDDPAQHAAALDIENGFRTGPGYRGKSASVQGLGCSFRWGTLPTVEPQLTLF